MPVPDFAPGEVLTAAAMDSIGLWLVKSSSFSAAATCPMESVFSSSYRNYAVFTSFTGSSAGANHQLVFYTGTNTEYTSALYYRYGFYAVGATLTTLAASTQTSMFLNNHSSVAANRSTTELRVYAPNNSSFKTNIRNDAWDYNSGLVIRTDNLVDVANSFTGFVVKPSTGTLTGNIAVYGYRD